MTNNGFIFDDSRIFFRQNGEDISPLQIEGVVTVAASSRGHGCRLGLVNGTAISVQWHDGAYCSNRFATLADNHSFSPDAEVAIISSTGEWHNFGHDTVEGWRSVEDVIGYIRQHSRNPAAA